MKFTVILKVSLAVLFFLCLLKMPYSYYQLVRFLALVGFVILAFDAYESKKVVESIIFIGLALLFQPFIKVALGRDLWNVIDVIVGIYLIVNVLFQKAKQ